MARRSVPAISRPRRPRAPEWSESEAREVIAACDASKLSRRAFCEDRGLTSSRLDYWRKRLAAVTPAPRFVEFSPAPPAEAGARVEICVGGVVVRVRESLDVGHLARIVAAFAGIVPPC